MEYKKAYHHRELKAYQEDGVNKFLSKRKVTQMKKKIIPQNYDVKTNRKINAKIKKLPYLF